MYIYMHVCFYIYKKLYTVHTHILCKHKLLFWMQVIIAQHYYIYIFLSR